MLRRAAAIATAAVMLAAAFVAGRASVMSAGGTAAVASGQHGGATTWTVREETVGRSLTFTGRITVSTTSGPVARSSGIVTVVHVDTPSRVEPGTVLYSVDLRPVVAAQGALPGFRELAQGAHGEDVAQLRGFLCTQGQPSACGDSHRFDPALAAAVRGWQEHLGIEPDGVVGPGDILWFPSLPARVRPTEALAPGEQAPDNVRPYTVDSGTPTLRVPVSREQAALVPVGAPVVVAGEYDAVVEQVLPAPAAAGEPDPGSQAEFVVSIAAGDDREPFCAVHPVCEQLLGQRESVPVEVVVHTVPELRGPVVPVAAVTTDPSGIAGVQLADGTRREITVVAVVGGIAVVDRLRPGEEIRLP